MVGLMKNTFELHTTVVLEDPSSCRGCPCFHLERFGYAWCGLRFEYKQSGIAERPKECIERFKD
jgi:hypothetical protein